MRTSVVIPYFNGSKYISQALFSCYEQTTPPLEVIVVDDGSREEEKEFLKGLTSEFDFRIIWGENRGQSAARNSGAMEAKGDLICFLDQDDFFLENHIQSLAETFENIESTRVALTHGQMWSANENGLVIDKTSMWRAAAREKETIGQFIEGDCHILPSSMCVSKDAFISVNGFDPNLRGYEDDDLVIRLFLGGFGIFGVEKPVSVYRRHQNNTYRSATMIDSAQNFYEKYLRFIKHECDSSNELRSLLSNRMRVVFANAIVGNLAQSERSSARLVQNLKLTSDHSNNLTRTRRLAIKIFTQFHRVLPAALLGKIVKMWVA